MDALDHDLQEILVVQNLRLSQPLDRDVFSETVEWNNLFQGSCSERDGLKCLTGEMKIAHVVWKSIAKLYMMGKRKRPIAGLRSERCGRAVYQYT